MPCTTLGQSNAQTSFCNVQRGILEQWQFFFSNFLTNWWRAYFYFPEVKIRWEDKIRINSFEQKPNLHTIFDTVYGNLLTKIAHGLCSTNHLCLHFRMPNSTQRCSWILLFQIIDLTCFREKRTKEDQAITHVLYLATRSDSRTYATPWSVRGLFSYLMWNVRVVIWK